MGEKTLPCGFNVADDVLLEGSELRVGLDPLQDELYSQFCKFCAQPFLNPDETQNFNYLL